MQKISEIRNKFLSLFNGNYNEFGYISYNVNEIDNPDESYLGTFNCLFQEIPDDDAKANTWCKEGQDFSDKLEEYLKSITDAQETCHIIDKVHSQDGHYFYHNDDGDTLQIHWNDMSLMIITSFSGQY